MYDEDEEKFEVDDSDSDPDFNEIKGAKHDSDSEEIEPEFEAEEEEEEDSEEENFSKKRKRNQPQKTANKRQKTEREVIDIDHSPKWIKVTKTAPKSSNGNSKFAAFSPSFKERTSQFSNSKLEEKQQELQARFAEARKNRIISIDDDSENEDHSNTNKKTSDQSPILLSRSTSQSSSQLSPSSQSSSQPSSLSPYFNTETKSQQPLTRQPIKLNNDSNPSFKGLFIYFLN